MMITTDIFKFESYRDYLNAWLAEAKLSKTSNLSRLAEVAEVHATFMSQVLLGRKDLSLEQASLLSVYLSQTRLEREKFFALVQLDRAGVENLREYWRERLRAIDRERNRLSERFAKHAELGAEAKATFYSSWIYAAVRLSTDIEVGQTLTQIASRFRRSVDEIELIMQFLVEHGLCVKKDDVFCLGPAHVHVPNESPFLSKQHQNWRTRAVVAVESRLPNELFFSAPMVISKKDFDVIREDLNLLVKRVVETAKASKSEDLYCLNIDFFGLLR